MTCTHALTLARRGDPAAAAAHLATCAACVAQLAAEAEALAIARHELAVTVPTAQVDRIVAAALADGPPRPVAWWDLALPIAWRAAAVLNLAGVIAVAWLATRETAAPPPRSAPASAATALDVDLMLTRETEAMLARSLGLGAEVAP
ncbi:MAG: hypothetical protein R2939_17975 [Kofleriaceae bacterium]